MAKKTKQVNFDDLYRITQNTHSKDYRVECNYRQEITGGKFEDHWMHVRGPYGRFSDASSAKRQEVEDRKTGHAQWLPV